MQNKSQQFLGIDILRFMAAAAVMLYHFVYFTLAYKSLVKQASLGLIALPELAPLSHWGWIGVEVFFVISGFVIALSAEKATAYQFFVSRFVRLVPAVWICAPITFLVLAHIQRPYWGNLFNSLMFQPFGPWIDSVYWTLGIEISFYAMVLGLLYFKRFSLIRPVAILIGSLSTLFWLALFTVEQFFQHHIPRLLESMETARLLDLLLIHHGCFFAIGVLVWHQSKKKSMHHSGLDWCLIGLFSIGSILQICAQSVLIGIRMPIAFPPAVAVSVWLAAMGFLLISVLYKEHFEQYPKWVFTLCRRLGLMTYPLYLIHQLNGGYIMGALAKRGVHAEIAVLVAIGISLVLSWIIAIIIEPPLQKTVKRILLQAGNAWSSLRFITRASKIGSQQKP